MAEEGGSTTKVYTLEDLIFVLFFLLILSHMLSRIPVFVEEQFGFRLGGSQVGLAAASIANDTPLGTVVSAPNGAPYADTPGGPRTGFLGAGTETALTDGPQALGFKRYWFVLDPETTEGGWVDEALLVRTNINGIQAGTALGTRVRTIVDADIWQTPGTATRTGQLLKDATGTLRDGPMTFRQGRWWFIDADDTDTDGWLPESALALLSGSGFERRVAVRAKHNTDLFERPGGGRTVAVMEEDETGRIADGPEYVASNAWWYVTMKRGPEGWVPESALTRGGLKGWFKSALFVFVVVASILAVILLAALMYVTLRTNQLRVKEARRIREAIPKASMSVMKNERWEQVMTNVSSANPNDWRLAIIEADIMLDELVTRMGYHGATLGEKLKQVTRGDVRSLDSAWEAHKVRNQIAHAGSDYILSQREARRVIELYGEVFSEFRFI